MPRVDLTSRFSSTLLALGLATACTGHDPTDPPPPQADISASTAVSRAFPNPYRAKIDYDATSSASIALIQRSALALDDDEMAVLARNGFVLSDRKAFPNFLMAYAEVYRNDLPVYVSADSILHALHKSYDAMLREVERTILAPLLGTVLQDLRKRLATQSGDARSRKDLDLHLAVALSLLRDEPVAPVAGASRSDVAAWYQRARGQQGMSDEALFGSPRVVDFSQFTPRGHYTESESLQRYFRATIWLGQVDFRMLSTTCEGERVVDRRQLAAALLLFTLVRGPVRERWEALDTLVTAFTAERDAMDLRDLGWLAEDLGVAGPAGLRRIPDTRLVEALSRAPRPRVVGHPLAACGAKPLAPPISFAFLPQRYTPESEVMTRVTHDRIPEKRFLPSTLDVAFAAFGNDQAAELLAPEIDEWGYSDALLSARRAFTLPTDHGFYRGWLEAIRALSVQEGEIEELPSVARTDAWGRRLLNTQLASWAELRRDTILYAKPSYGSILCEYPDGYVDPYPAFFERMTNVAAVGLRLADQVEKPKPVEDPEDTFDSSLAGRMRRYFVRLEEISTALGEMAHLERQGKPLREDHVEFLNRAVSASSICGGFVTDGWYADLFFDQGTSTEFKPTIADVHTDPNGPARVLHVATGAPRLMYVTVDSAGDRTTFVGPVSSYFEKVGAGLKRWTDETWKRALLDSPPPQPSWMKEIVVAARFEAPEDPSCMYWKDVLMGDEVLRGQPTNWPWPLRDSEVGQ
jgi:hypothetical protein